MSKPAPRSVKLPDGSEIIPEHYHEGPEATRMFQRGVRSVLGVSRAEAERRHKEWERQPKAKRGRKPA